jgi:hypothetical protein
VLREGVPAAGVPIATVPDIVEFATTEDVTELFGGEARSDRDGRFVVSLPSRGIAELRVGDDTWRVRRLLLGVIGSLPSVVDVGTIDLTALPPLTFVLEDSGGCDVVVSGPIGHSGVTAHRATRLGPAMFRTTLPEPGSWLISATCAGRSRDVVPPVVEITAGTGERTVRLVWR